MGTRPTVTGSLLLPLLALLTPAVPLAKEESADARARETEQRMTDDERL
jgi:hypothetical protein